MTGPRRHLVVLAAALACGFALQARAALVFTDWTSINEATNVAAGTIGATSVTLSGSGFQTGGGVTNGTETYFNSSFFTPALANTDALYLFGNPAGTTYTVTFGSAVLDPTLHLGSLASTLTFASGTSITELSDDGNLTVSGNTVSGITFGSTDANGTIRLNGTFTSFSFTTQYVLGADGIGLQFGAHEIPSQVPEPSGLALALSALLMLGGSRVLRSRRS